MTLTRTAAPARPASRTRSIVTTGAAYGVAGAAAATAVALVAEGLGVPMEAAEASAPAGEHIPLYGYAMSVAISTVVGVLIALGLARWAKQPARTFTVVAVALTALSFALPHTTHHATTATRLALDLTHVAAAAVIVPALARRLR